MSEATSVQVGQFVRVPKGAIVFNQNPGEGERDVGPSKRMTTAEVTTVLKGEAALNWLRERYHREGQWATMRARQMNPVPETHEQKQIKAEMVRLGQNGIIVGWGEKRTIFAGIEPTGVSVVEPPTRVSKGPSKIQQMVPGSRWKITQDVELTVSGHDNAKKVNGDVSDVPYLRASAGTTIEITGKKHATIFIGPPGANMWMSGLEARGVFLQAKVLSGSITLVTGKPTAVTSYHNRSPDTTHLLPYAALEPVVEAESVPLVKVVVLRDSASGEFFKEAWPSRFSDKPRLDMVPSFAKAKKWDDLGVLKGAINNFTGYFAGMPYGYGAGRPDWMGDGEKVCDLPPTFEAVVYDKLAKTEIETVDIQAWHARTWKLRALTIKYGSAVRKVYNELDKKGTLDEFPYVVAISVPVEDDRYYPRELTDAERAEFEDLIGSASLKRSDVRRARDDHSIALALRDANTAFLIKLLYRGTLPIVVLNMQTLQEEVQTEGERQKQAVVA